MRAVALNENCSAPARSGFLAQVHGDNPDRSAPKRRAESGIRLAQHSLPRLLKLADVEALRSSFFAESIVCGIVHLGRSRQNPEVLAARIAYERMCVIRRERDDLATMPIERPDHLVGRPAHGLMVQLS